MKINSILIIAALLIGCGTKTTQSESSEEDKRTENAGERIILITGSTSGLGREVARALVDQGDHVIIHGRSKKRGDSLLNELNAKRANSARFYTADFASLDAIHGLAEQIREEYQRIDVLVNNAGVVVPDDRGRVLSKDGYELTFQVNYLSNYLLVNELLPLLEKGNRSRIVTVSSGSSTETFAELDFDNLMLEEGYDSYKAYSQSKLAQVMHAMELSAMLKDRGIIVNSLHPSTLMNTKMVADIGLDPLTSVFDGRDAVLQLINDDIGTGGYYNVMQKDSTHAQAYIESVRVRLWQVSDQLIKDRLRK